jgi:hypothetical protein
VEEKRSMDEALATAIFYTLSCSLDSLTDKALQPEWSLRETFLQLKPSNLGIITVMSRNAWWILGGLALVAAFGYQSHRISKLSKELAVLRSEIVNARPVEGAPAFKDGPAPIKPISQDQTVGVEARIVKLERSMAEINRASEMLAARGMIPPTPENLAQLQQRFLDPATGDEERLQTLRSLRRSGGLSDEVVAQALNSLQTSTNMELRRELLGHLGGLTNAVLKQPLLAMLNTETDNGMRDQLVNSLRRFAGEPEVEAKLWDLALNDSNARIREVAREAVARAPVTPERVEQLRTKAANPDASLEERLISFRALRLAKSHTPELVSDFAAMAQSTTDPVARAKLFKSFNGLTDEFLMAPLVSGLQDPDPVVRQSAADSLSSFPDPRVQEWLNHLIQNDADPAVKREAHEALEQSQRLSRRAP